MKTKYSKEQVDDMREMLVNSEWEMEGVSDEQIIKQYENVYGEWGKNSL